MPRQKRPASDDAKTPMTANDLYIKGYQFYYGRGELIDKEKGMELLEEAAEQGNNDAHFLIGKAYKDGDATVKRKPGMSYIKVDEENSRRAEARYRAAADNGHPKAQRALGHLLYHKAKSLSKALNKQPEKVKKYYSEALDWYNKAIDNGVVSANNNLGIAYYEGNGVDQDIDESFKLFKKAADGGDVHGQINTGIAYFEGAGVEKNIYQAISWLAKAAAQDHVAEKHNTVARERLQTVCRGFVQQKGNHSGAKPSRGSPDAALVMLCQQYVKEPDTSPFKRLIKTAKEAEEAVKQSAKVDDSMEVEGAAAAFKSEPEAEGPRAAAVRASQQQTGRVGPSST